MGAAPIPPRHRGYGGFPRPKPEGRAKAVRRVNLKFKCKKCKYTVQPAELASESPRARGAPLNMACTRTLARSGSSSAPTAPASRPSSAVRRRP